MQVLKHILDNRRGSTVADYLKRQLSDADSFRVVSAYFTIYGYDLLANELDRIEDIRFLFGDPESVHDPDPGGRDQKSFELTDQGLRPTQALVQKALARQCAEWVERDSVSIRSISRSNFLHGKMYLADSSDASAGVVGSSNFTKGGLGGSENPNLEINIAVDDEPTLGELRDWFDDVWGDGGLTEDVKEQVLAALNRLGQDHAPELVYYKTLYELFRKDIEARLDDDDYTQEATNLRDTEIWSALYEFQRDGAKSLLARLRQYNGCILADSVGLGKTYTALAVIKYFEMRNQRVLVLCPKKLRQNWSLYQASNNHIDNPFIDDRFGYTLLSHTDLGRDGRVGDIDLASFNWGSFDLVVIDESHNFRNMDGSRYQFLMEEVIKKGVGTKLLLLSATPVNTSLTDLRNQVYLMTEGREADFRESLGISNVRNLLGTAEREFRRWERAVSSSGARNKTVLLNNLGAGFFRLLGAVSISRSRRQIEQFYPDQLDLIGKFPAHTKPDNHYPVTDLQGELSYKAMSDQIDEFELSIYRPSDYLVDEDRLRGLEEERKVRNFNQKDRERFLIGMIRTNFLKRLESSAWSLTLTLERTIGKIDAVLEQIERQETKRKMLDEQAEPLPDDDEDDEDFLVTRGRDPYRLRELDLTRWCKDLNRDRKTLQVALDSVKVVTPVRDGKLNELRRAIRNSAENPSVNRDDREIRKLLVFTTFMDTAEYLYTNLADLASELGLHIAMVAGDATHTTFGPNNFNAILTNFAPVARNRGSVHEPGEIDLLIATDCISEGQNLQDCDTVLNYDIHWNPVRVIQRFGRIDRIGSRNDTVQMVNYWPTEEMDVYLRLRHRVQARMALADMTAGGDGDPFSEEQLTQELVFRDKQLLKLREEVLDLDDLTDTPVMSDFTLDQFLIQLQRFLEQNRERLESMPLGAYAVAGKGLSGNGINLRPGVLFCLRQRNAPADRSTPPASPVHPHYLVYVQDDGRIRYECANIREALNAFESGAAGLTSAVTDLCDRFDSETDNGRDMDHYDRLLKNVVAHIQRSQGNTLARGVGLDGTGDLVLPKVSETPQSEADFELVTWLVIAPQWT